MSVISWFLCFLKPAIGSKHIITPIKHKHFLVLIGVVQGEAMQLKYGLVALSVMATLVLAGGTTAQAKSNEKPETKPTEVYVTVMPGDNLSVIAATHETSYIRLFNANEAITNPDLIYADQQLRVPRADEQLPDRLSQMTVEQQSQIIAAAGTTAQYAPAAGSTARGSSAGNTYAWGYCTWWAKEMRPDLPNRLGNGGQWVANAALQGIATGTVARAGAIAEQPGHVAYVESVSPGGGTVNLSEMNYGGGIGQVHRRSAPASSFRYIY